MQCVRERAGALVENEAAGGHVVGKAVVDQIAGAETGGKERPRSRPGIGAQALRLPHRAGRHEHTVALQRFGIGKAAKRRIVLLHLHQFRLAQDRQLRQRGAIRQSRRIRISKPGGKRRQAFKAAGKQSPQSLECFPLADFGRTGFPVVEMAGHRGSPKYGVPA